MTDVIVDEITEDVAPGQATLFGEDDEFKIAYQLWRGMPNFDQRDLEPWKSLLVHFECRQDLEAFKAAIGQPKIGLRTKSIWYPYQEWEMVVDVKQWKSEL